MGRREAMDQRCLVREARLAPLPDCPRVNLVVRNAGCCPLQPLPTFPFPSFPPPTRSYPLTLTARISFEATTPSETLPFPSSPPPPPHSQILLIDTSRI